MYFSLAFFLIPKKYWVSKLQRGKIPGEGTRELFSTLTCFNLNYFNHRIKLIFVGVIWRSQKANDKDNASKIFTTG